METRADLDAWITAVRRDQSPHAAAQVIERRKFGLIKINPLVRWSTIGIWKHLQHNVPYNQRDKVTLHRLHACTTSGRVRIRVRRWVVR